MFFLPRLGILPALSPEEEPFFCDTTEFKDRQLQANRVLTEVTKAAENGDEGALKQLPGIARVAQILEGKHCIDD